jgi:hypothetical protein
MDRVHKVETFESIYCIDPFNAKSSLKVAKDELKVVDFYT